MALVIHPTLPSLVHLPCLCLREIKCKIFAVVQFDCIIVLADFEPNVIVLADFEPNVIVLADFEPNENVTPKMSQEN